MFLEADGNEIEPQTNCTDQLGLLGLENSKAQGDFQGTKFTLHSAPLLAPGNT